MTGTPYYHFDLRKIENNYNQLKKLLGVDRLFYALKPNSEIPVLQTLNNYSADFEVASLGEFNKLKEIGVDSSRIICSLPIKKAVVIQELYKNGIEYFVFDNLIEYKKLQKYAPSAKKILRISVDDFVENAIEFGAQYDEINAWIASGHINPQGVDGLTFYINKNKFIHKVITALERCEEILKLIGNRKIINIGGNYRLDSEVSKDFYDVLKERIVYFKTKYECIFYAEPGRSVVKTAGKLFTTIIATKEKQDCYYIYIDAGLPTGISYAPKIISIQSKQEFKTNKKYKFFDITCSHRLLFETNIKYNLAENDILIFEDFGSYSICKASNFHGWDRPTCMYDNFNRMK